MDKTTFVCVYRSGGDFTADYVNRLYRDIAGNVTEPFQLVCLTDMPVLFRSSAVDAVLLKHGWPGWWSKIELFRPELKLKNAIYFDLDTIVLKNIDLLCHIRHGWETIVPLKGFNEGYKPDDGRRAFASGVMIGNFAACHDVYNKFATAPINHMISPAKPWQHGDQGFIASVITHDLRLQDFLPEGYIIGKKTVQRCGIPEGAKIIAWSGRPRLHEMKEIKGHKIW